MSNKILTVFLALWAIAATLTTVFLLGYQHKAISLDLPLGARRSGDDLLFLGGSKQEAGFDTSSGPSGSNLLQQRDLGGIESGRRKAPLEAQSLRDDNHNEQLEHPKQSGAAKVSAATSQTQSSPTVTTPAVTSNAPTTRRTKPPPAKKATTPSLALPPKTAPPVRIVSEAERIGEAVPAQRTAATCKEPNKRIVYIKTHKTGSSTLTNIFHRFAAKHDLRAAVPKDNIFYGWPGGSKHAIMGSIEVINDNQTTYDVFCSGHSRYHYEALNELVPGASYVTIFRNPLTHFFSSWNHWHVGDHIREGGGGTVTPGKFLENPEQYTRFMRFSDKILIKNSYMYDFNVEQPTIEKVREVIEEIEAKFTLVLITEFIDESLVLMRRKFCWSLDDIIYYALKVTTGDHADEMKKKSLDPIANRQIAEYSWADKMLYDHFNASLWRQLALEDGIAEEVALLRSRLDEISTTCSKFQILNEDSHRVALEDVPDTSEADKDCHYLQLDSKGFVKHLKHKAGFPVEKLECWATHAVTKMIHLQTHQPVDDVLVSIMLQWATLKNLNVALPDPAHYENWDPYKDIARQPTSYLAPPGTLQMLSVPGWRFNRLALEKTVPLGPFYLGTIRHPVQEFLDAWTKLGMEGVLKERMGSSVSLAQFLEKPQTYLSALGPDYERMLVNRISYHFGADKTISQDDLLTLLKYMQWFQLIMLAEYKFESIVLLRRINCWDIKDVVLFSDAKWATAVKHSLSDYVTPTANVRQLEDRIMKLNALDGIVYRQANSSFWGLIERQVSFNEELNKVKRMHTEAIAQCDATLKALDGSPPKTPAQHACFIRDLDMRDLFNYAKTRVYSGRQYHSATLPAV